MPDSPPARPRRPDPSGEASRPTDGRADEPVDCAVVGGGPAGLSAALNLARYRRSVLVLDTDDGRSTGHQVNHNLLGHPGGIPARELRRLGWAQLDAQPEVRRGDGPVSDLRVVDDGFEVVAPGGTTVARTVVLATGVRDHFPRFDGWESCVGRSMFWCLACDAYEHRGDRVVVAGSSDAAAGEALQLRRYSEDLTLVTNGRARLSPRWAERVERAGIPVVEGRIVEAVHDGGHLRRLRLDDGRDLELGALFVAQGATPASDLAARVGAELNDDGWVVVDEEQHTTVPGLFAAGDVTALHSHQVATAMHEGTQAAAAVNYFLYPTTLRAVEPADVSGDR